METVIKRMYEGMFLVDSAEAASDWEGVNGAIETVLQRSEAEVVSLRKWEERKLAYEIKGKSRGTYILCYFRAAGEKIRDIERDVQLSEKILRVIILNAEHMSTEDIEKDTPLGKAEKKAELAKEAAEKARAIKEAELEESEKEIVVNAIEFEIDAVEEAAKEPEAEPVDTDIEETEEPPAAMEAISGDLEETEEEPPAAMEAVSGDLEETVEEPPAAMEAVSEDLEETEEEPPAVSEDSEKNEDSTEKE